MKNIKKFYDFKNYKPNKNAKPVTYKGTNYLSKAQCMALEDITRKELDEYLLIAEPIVIEAPDPIDEQKENEAEMEDILDEMEELPF